MTITSARHPTLPPRPDSLWILPVPWKTRAIRSAATAPSPKARFHSTLDAAAGGAHRNHRHPPRCSPTRQHE